MKQRCEICDEIAYTHDEDGMEICEECSFYDDGTDDFIYEMDE